MFDIVQDTYMKAFDHLDSFQGDTKFLPWVRQIAANGARDWLKKKRPMLFTELGSGDGQDTPVEELLADERSENLPDQIIDQEEPEVSEAPKEDSQSAEETEGSEGEDAQSDEEAEEEVSFPYSYIFSDMPVAAYEITGLGVGRFESVNEEMIYFKGETIYFEGEDEGGYNFGNYPFIRLTPGENTFVLFCMQGDEEGVMDMSAATIHSPSGSSQWEAITYTSEPMGYTFGDFTNIERARNPFNEEKHDGSVYSYFIPFMEMFAFAEIYHPDSPQDDTIYVIGVNVYSDDVVSSWSESYDEIDDYLARLINTFEGLGATDVKEISVEEALERCNVVVSEGEMN